MSHSNSLFPPSSARDIETCKSGDAVLANSADLEKSRPPTPHGEGLPTNFAEVVGGVYRSSFPLQPHLKALAKLSLKTIITLVDEECPTEYLEFIEENGINHQKIHIVANKDPNVYASQETVNRVQKLVLDKSNHPLLIHCNKGKHRTGCMVACFRKLQEWSLNAALTEYVKYSEPKSRVLDRKFITEFDETILSGLAKEVGASNWVRQLFPLAVEDDSNAPNDEGFISELKQVDRSFSY